MRFLTIVFASHAEFLAHYSATESTNSNGLNNGALFCPTKVAAQEKERVVVDISIPYLRRPARLSGTVVSQVHGQGLWVYFDSKSRASAEYLRTLASTESRDRLSRAHSRYPASWAVRFRIDETGQQTPARSTHIADLSRGGAFVVDNHAPLVGTRVTLEIGSQDDGYRVNGCVAWLGRVGRAEGFGVRFDQKGSQSAALRTMLRRASERGLLSLD